jgi:hypothetical protein
VQAQVAAIGRAFAVGLQKILGPKLYAAYIYGAAAFPDGAPTGDVDFHVIVEEALTTAERQALEALHETLAAAFPPLGAEMDGYYILLADARGAAPPQSEMWRRATDHAWALHRAHIRAGRYIALYGPDPRTIYRPATWAELEAALYQELDYVAQHLQVYPDYCALNLCRLIYSFTTRDVVISKAGAATWAQEVLPAWRWLITLAQQSYAGQTTAAEREQMQGGVTRFYTLALARIAAATGER